jgi:DNA-binding CsgD family transcriptional regulator
MKVCRAAQGMLAGMPAPKDLHRIENDGRVVIAVGTTALFDYAADDAELRNLVAVTLPSLGFTARRVAEVLGITEVYVSMLRSRVRKDGSAALTRRRGRPPALGAADVAKAARWRAAGEIDAEIGRRLGVHATTVARALPHTAEAGAPENAQPVQDVLVLPSSTDAAEHDAAPVDAAPVEPEPAVATSPATSPFTGSARITTGVARSRYAGAMLLYPYLHRVGAEAIFATLAGGPARRYDDMAVLSTATLGFALGIDTVEGAKHLRRGEAGAAVGLGMTPELATLRGRLGGLADDGEPLALQRAFATGMLAADPCDDPVYFVDDHFVAYSGAKPVAKGWNTKRRHAQPGRADTLVTDARGRAVVFASGEATGLVATLPGVLGQLREVIGPHGQVLLGFDRGGAYPSTFLACRAAGAHWLTYRRAPLVSVGTAPKRSWTVRDGRRVTVMLADETVELAGYGPARQLSLFEAGVVVLQVLTSDTSATGASLLWWLRARWRIENVFKYASDHNGIDSLADYRMDISTDERAVKNPARALARGAVAAAETELAEAERALAQLPGGPGTVAEMNAALPSLQRRIATAATAAERAKVELAAVPAKVLATVLDPGAKRARPRLARRGLQMVLRLLAFNAEAWLAEHFNAYLVDPNEYRAILRHLLHLGGQVDYSTKGIVVTLDRPDSPRVARALELLAEELNATPACLPGDRRQLAYRVAEAS